MPLIYGDRIRVADPAELLAVLAAGCARVDAMPAGILRHGELAGVLIAAGELAQGLADAARERAGQDDSDPATDAAMALVGALAEALLGSWRGGFATVKIDADENLAALRACALPPQIRPRTAEGFAFYAVYPEAYAIAAEAVGAGTMRVIGLRSIGTVLAAMAAAALRAPPPGTLRPVGHPFARTIVASDRLAAAIEPDATYLVADEGPGASGSSFGAAAEWLGCAGVPSEQVVFLPSHGSPPGPMGSAAAAERWCGTRQRVASLTDDCRFPEWLAAWFADVIGPIEHLTDLSGGAWREHGTPCQPMFERRKYLARAPAGTFLLKFVGLGATGRAKWALARRLHDAGFVPEPVGLRHGFLAERWQEAVPAVPTLARLGAYLGFRARHLPAAAVDGADLPTLCHMARHNAAERLGEAAAARLPLDPALPVAPVRVDGRLHRWEWLGLADGCVLKADALDHHCGHDLVGCQDIAWDVAGASVEFDLSGTQTSALRRAVDAAAGRATNPRLIATMRLCYAAFQLGLWEGGQDAAGLLARYERVLVTPPPCPP